MSAEGSHYHCSCTLYMVLFGEGIEPEENLQSDIDQQQVDFEAEQLQACVGG